MDSNLNPFDYARPEIFSVRALDRETDLYSLKTTGGDIVVVQGANFGPATEVASVSLEYAMGSSVRALAGDSAGELGSYQYQMARCSKPQGGIQAHRLLHCTTPPGVGRGLVLRSQVHGQDQSDITCFDSDVDSADARETDASVVEGCGNATLAFVSFAPPTISAVTGADGSDTRGGQSFTVVGTGFGPALLSTQGSITSVLYGPASGGSLRYDATPSCRVTIDDTEVECVTLPGTGMDLSFTINIAGQAPEASRLDTELAYAQPVLALFEGEGAIDAETPGGQVVVLRGNNFGPVGADTPLEATYDLEVAGIGGIRFNASMCSLVEAHVTIECHTAPGAGRALAWKVEVDGQTSRSPTTNYEIPMVHHVTRDGGSMARVHDADVDGGETLVLTGRGFGDPALVLFDSETGESIPAL